jgi:heat shock protein HtpX
LPLRRILYNETWSLPVYLSVVIRFFLAVWSFWILVAGLPAIALWMGERAWIVAVVMGVGLMLLAARQADMIRWMIAAQPIADEEIRARFDRLVAAAGLPTPHFEFVDLKGGSLANAVALASLGRSSVVFSGPLLTRLDADETDAICAHELAHLEYYNVRRLRHRRLVSRSLVIAAALLTPLLQLVVPSLAWLACAAWPTVVLVAIGTLERDRQKHETASDLRAVALTGNPEALVRALVKLHAMARVPRRWDADLERHMSHPSLKRRIQDIRAAAGTPPAALGDAAVFESADGTARVVFGNDGLEWIEGAAASHRLRYDRFSELRIAATRTGETSLVAADRAGHRWHMPLRVEDVSRIQAVLDIVDAQIGVSNNTPAPVFQAVLIRAATLVVVVVSANAGLIGTALVLMLTLFRPETPLLGAAGLAAIGGAILAWSNPGGAYGFIGEGFDNIFMMFAAMLIASGALLIWVAYARRRNETPARVWTFVAIIAVAAVASWVLPILGNDLDAVGLHQAARAWPSSVVLPLALAGALLWSSRKILRVAAAGASAASIIAAGVGTQAFLDRFGSDLFLVPAADLKVRTLDHPIKEFTIPFAVAALHLSPSGRSIAVVSRGQDNRTVVHIGRAGETLTRLDADGGLFIDDDRALVWTVDGSRTDLREVLVNDPATAGWNLQVLGFSTRAVSLDPKSKRWRLTNAGVNAFEAREGVIGADQIESHRWSVPAGHAMPLMPIAVSGDRALAVEPRPDLDSLSDPFGALLFVLASAPHWRSTIWSLGPDEPDDLGTSRLELECHALPLVARGACYIFDASRTRFFAMDAETHGVNAVASLPGRFFVGEEPQGSWITGWYRTGPLAVRLAPLDAIRVAGPNGSRPHMLAASEHAAAGVWHQMPAASGLRVEAIYQWTGTATIRIYSID